MKPDKFIKLLKPDALKIQKEHGIPAAAIIAQAALETGWLKHPIKDKYTGRNSYNLFGIKHHGQGDYVVINTHEYEDGKKIVIEDKFKAYSSYKESILGHMEFLFDNPRYKKTLEADDPREFVRELQKAGYATDPDYAKKLISIMENYDLIKLTNKKEQKFNDVSPNHWAFSAIERMSEEGIINGYPDGDFKPDKNITRAELAVILDRLKSV